MSEAFIQLYDKNGEPIDKKVDVLEIGTKGLLHGASHVWVWRKKREQIELLLQQRSSGMPTWPGYLHSSAAGHINYGETPLQAVIRETSEEIGLEIVTAPELLFMQYSYMPVPHTDYIEHEFRWIYAYEYKEDDNLQVDDAEVSGLLWVSREELTELIKGISTKGKIIPEESDYFLGLNKYLDRVEQNGPVYDDHRNYRTN